MGESFCALFAGIARELRIGSQFVAELHSGTPRQRSIVSDTGSQGVYSPLTSADLFLRTQWR
jgi:hypothetical protein